MDYLTIFPEFVQNFDDLKKYFLFIALFGRIFFTITTPLTQLYLFYAESVSTSFLNKLNTTLHFGYIYFICLLLRFFMDIIMIFLQAHYSVMYLFVHFMNIFVSFVSFYFFRIQGHHFENIKNIDYAQAQHFAMIHENHQMKYSALLV